MSDQVFRYRNVEDYLDPKVSGVAVSKKFATLQEAEKFQAFMRDGDEIRYYGICHLTGCCIRENDGESRK